MARSPSCSRVESRDRLPADHRDRGLLLEGEQAQTAGVRADERGLDHVDPRRDLVLLGHRRLDDPHLPMLERRGETLPTRLLKRQQDPRHRVEVVVEPCRGEGLAGEPLGLEPGAALQCGFGLLHRVMNGVDACLGHRRHDARPAAGEQAVPRQRWSGSTSMNRMRASAATRSATSARACTLPVRVVPRRASTSSTT